MSTTCAGSWPLCSTGRAGDRLLDSYETERRPVDQANIDNALANADEPLRHRQSAELVGGQHARTELGPAATAVGGSPESAAKRHALNQAIASQTIEFRHHNVEFGYVYRSGAIVHDCAPEPEPIDGVRVYEPSTNAGHPLPHAFVEREGQRMPLCDLVHGGHFVLVCGEQGQRWVEAAERIAVDNGLPLRAITVGLDGCDYVDVRAAWLKQRGVSPRGAVLVRPDRYIAFRALEAVDDPSAALKAALGQVLATELV